MIELSSMKHRFRALAEAERDVILEAYDRATRPATRAGIDIYLKEYSWWIHEGDLRLPADVVNDIHLIVTGDLIVDGWYDDDASDGGMLAVLGNMRCHHVFSQYTLYVAGDLLVNGLNLQFYNDWIFECGGRMAARAYIGLDKAAGFDKESMDVEAFYRDRDFEGRSSRKPFELLGMLPVAESLADDDEDEDEDWCPDARDIIRWVKGAEADGRAPFIAPERLPLAVWREAQHAATSPQRLIELIAGHGWDVAMRPDLAPDLQQRLMEHDDPRVRWAIASSPSAGESVLRHLAGDPSASVRAAVAGHADCPPDLWVRFAADAAPGVRAAVVHAHGQEAADWVLALAGDPEPVVRRAVAVVPLLPAEAVALLSDDPDRAVKNRVLRTQQHTLDALRAQLDNPDEGVRFQLANTSKYQLAPFAPDSVGHPLREEALARFMLDESARVRAIAVVSFLAPAFYETHAERMAVDEVPGIRAALACKTRQAAWLAKLAEDDDMQVRVAVASNPHTPAAALRALTERGLGAPLGFDDRHKLVGALLDNPALPEDAVARLFLDRMPRGFSMEPHPHAPLELVVPLVCADPYCDESDPEYAVYRQCLEFIDEERDLSHEERDALLRYIVAARCRSLTGHALGNAACPPDLLMDYVSRYLRKEADADDAIQVVAANPALPVDAIRQLAAYLAAERDWEVQQGLLRNPSCPADVLTELAASTTDDDCRRETREALWRWHGIAA